MRPVIGVEEFNATTAACTITGTAGNDRLRGTRRDDVICGLGGDDRIDGRDGDDAVFGDAGSDWIDGGDDEDTLYGGDGDDRLDGEQGWDVLSRGPERTCSNQDGAITPSRGPQSRYRAHAREVGVHDLPLVREAELLHHAP